MLQDAVVNAVISSQEKYFGVSSMLKKALPVTWEIHFNGAQLFTNQAVETAMEVALV